jgi:hypothetical protein
MPTSVDADSRAISSSPSIKGVDQQANGLAGFYL